MMLPLCCMIIVEKHHAVVKAWDGKAGHMPKSHLGGRNNGILRGSSFRVQWTTIMSALTFGLTHQLD